MTSIHPTEARFPQVPSAKGHYESFYLKACHPEQPLGVWIRYTVHKRPGGPPKGSLWFTYFDASTGSPRAEKLTLPGPEVVRGNWIKVGEAVFGDGQVSGATAEMTWNLRFESAEAPLFHLPKEWMYRRGLPRTKMLSPAPAATFNGRLTVDGRPVELEGWRGMVGHNWGAEHAKRWIWLHGLTGEGHWLDAAIGRVKLGPATTPWVANGALSLDGRRHALGGLRAKAEIDERADGCRFVLPGEGVTVRGEVSAAREGFVGWLYSDPDGSEHHAVNCSIADMRLSVEREHAEPVELVVEGGAAYELGMRETDHGVPIQRFPDG